MPVGQDFTLTTHPSSTSQRPSEAFQASSLALVAASPDLRSASASVRVPEERFSDVAGVDEVVGVLKEIALDVAAWRIDPAAVELPRGILLYGDGSAKSLLARALAGELESPQVRVSSHTLLGMSDGERELDRALSALRNAAPSDETKPHLGFLHIEDLDLLLEPCGGEEAQVAPTRLFHAVMARLLEVEEKGGNRVIVTASSTVGNKELSRTLFRPFDLALEVLRPTSVSARCAILAKLAEKKCASSKVTPPSEVDLRYVARMTAGLAGDDLELVISYAVQTARRAGNREIDLGALVEGVERHARGVVGRELLRPEDLRRIEVHEDGHGVVANVLGIPTLLISSTPRGRTGGCVVPDLSNISDGLFTRKEGLSAIVVLMAGIASERVNLGEQEVSNGGGADLMQTHTLLNRMVTAGMFVELINPGSVMRTSSNPGQCPAESVAPLHRLVENARLLAEGIVREVGDKTFEKIAEARSALGGKVFGPEAERFYHQFVPAQKRTGMERRLKRFIDKPFAEGGGGEGKPSID